MSAYPSRRRAHLITTRLRRITAALAILAGGLLAWAAAAPAASAAIIPVPDGPYGPAPASPVQVIAAGGMPGWQITVIALVAPPPRCSWTARGPAAGPPPPSDDTRKPAQAPPAGPGPRPTVQARPGTPGQAYGGPLPTPSQRQNTQIRAPQKTSAGRRATAPNGGSSRRACSCPLRNVAKVRLSSPSRTADEGQRMNSFPAAAACSGYSTLVAKTRRHVFGTLLGTVRQCPARADAARSRSALARGGPWPSDLSPAHRVQAQGPLVHQAR